MLEHFFGLLFDLARDLDFGSLSYRLRRQHGHNMAPFWHPESFQNRFKSVLELELCDVDIRTDSAYVINGAKQLQAWKAKGFWTKRREIRDTDLWRRLEALANERAHGSYKLTKAKCHATAFDVKEGRVTLQDKIGNDNADALAVAGASQSGQGWKAREHFRRHLRLRTAVQHMFCDIVLERERRRQSAGDMAQIESSSDSSFSSISFASSSAPTSET